jgi:hypothetical protein
MNRKDGNLRENWFSPSDECMRLPNCLFLFVFSAIFLVELLSLGSWQPGCFSGGVAVRLRPPCDPMPRACAPRRFGWASSLAGLVARGHQHDALPGTQGVMERLVNLFEGVFRREIAQRGAGLNKVAEVVGGKLLMLVQVLVQNH